MSRESRRRAKTWNTVICPAIEIAVEFIGCAATIAMIFGGALIATLIFG